MVKREGLSDKVNTGARLNQATIEKITREKLIAAKNFSYVDGPSSLLFPKPHKVLFIDDVKEETMRILTDKRINQSLLIVPEDLDSKIKAPHIICENPRIVFSSIITAIFDYFGRYFDEYHSNDEAEKYYPKTRFMPGTKIHKSAKIGKDSLLFPNVVVGPNCEIGERVLVKSNSVIGQPGFGIILGTNYEHTHLPHVGGVIIENDVEIGALNTISAGTIHPTVLECFVKTDDHVHIAHNCYLSKGAQLAAHVEISGSVSIGKGVWVGPNSSITDGIEIGDDAFLGIGTNVRKSIPAKTRVAGNPPRILR